ncbi:MAG: hypothetical protein JSS40_08390 [Proteobacteria bacterium]|nr:hypothetical protein [Pseudomonadota bacterium]
MAILGTQVTTPTFPGTVVQAGTLNTRAWVDTQFIAPAAGWVTRLGAWMRRNGNSPKVTLALYAVLPDGTPGALLGKTAPFNPTSGGGDYAGPLVDASGNPTAAQLEAGQRFAIAFNVINGSIEYPNLSLTTVWKRQTTSGVPTNPLAPTLFESDYAFPAYADFTSTAAPTMAILTPVNGASVNTSAPTFSGTYADANNVAPIYDKLAQYGFEVRLLGQTTLLWGGAAATFAASSGEQAANQWSRVYGGSALAGGSTYEWRARVADQTGTWSPWTVWNRFSVNALGQVDVSVATSPAAKVDTDSSLIAWGGNWFHPQGLSANLAQVQILQDGLVLKLGAQATPSPATVASSAVPGTAFTVPAASSGIGAIQPGTYQYQLRARASDGQWSSWSAPDTFVINAPANVPSGIQPPSGAASTSRPLLEWFLSDPDPDDVPGADVQSEVELTRPNGSIINFTTLNYNTIEKTGFYQLGATEMPAGSYGTYKVRVRAQDLSAGALGYSAWSGQQTFDWVSGATVAISAPTEGQVVGTAAPTIAWTVTGGTQQRFQVTVYLEDHATPIRSSGQVSSAVSAYTIPAGWLLNDTDYDLDVTVWDASNAKWVSLRRHFRVHYSAPDLVTGAQVSYVKARRDFEPSVAFVTWDYTNYPPGEFGGYVLRRREQGEALDDAIVLQAISSAGQNQWRDHFIPGNTPCLYSISQLRRVGADVLESAPVDIEATLALNVATLSSAIDPEGVRAAMMWLDGDIGGGFDRPEQAYITWGSQGKEILITSPADYGAERLSFTITVMNDTRGSMMDHFQDVRALMKAGHPLCLRMEHERWFFRVDKWSWKRAGLGKRTISCSFKETGYVEGVTAPIA